MRLTLPAPLAALARRLPEGPPATLLAAALNLALRRGVLARAALEPLAGSILRLEATDAGSGVSVTLAPGGFRAARGPADVTIRAALADYLRLALRREDPDTLFFTRRLVIEGDTELGLVAKNALDAVDWDALPAPLRQVSARLAGRERPARLDAYPKPSVPSPRRARAARARFRREHMQETSEQSAAAPQAMPALAAGWAFFLDVDGTLVELVERPELAQADAGLITLLGALQRGAGGALALISGRSVADVDALFAPLVLAVAGQHGIERRDAAGRVHRHSFPAEPLRRAAARLQAFAAAHAGVLLEDKGHSLALHYRQAPQHGAAADAEMRALAGELGEAFELQGGKMVYELKPGGRDKGSAIEEFMGEAPFRGRTPVFVGDDLTDEYGFGVVNRLGGHAVKVGAGRSAARWRLADAQAVRRWLGDWVARFGSRAP